jgi:hypothetical protein
MPLFSGLVDRVDVIVVDRLQKDSGVIGEEESILANDLRARFSLLFAEDEVQRVGGRGSSPTWRVILEDTDVFETFLSDERTFKISLEDPVDSLVASAGKYKVLWARRQRNKFGTPHHVSLKVELE